MHSWCTLTFRVSTTTDRRRKTNETAITVDISLDGTGKAEVHSVLTTMTAVNVYVVLLRGFACCRGTCCFLPPCACVRFLFVFFRISKPGLFTPRRTEPE